MTCALCTTLKQLKKINRGENLYFTPVLHHTTATEEPARVMLEKHSSNPIQGHKITGC